MRMLVLGASGQIAKALHRAGTSRSTVVTRGRPDVDVTRLRMVSDAISAIGPDLIVNAAAFTAVDEAEKNPNDAYAVNEAGAGNVATAAKVSGIPLIHLSTDYVFDGRKGTAYDETDAPRPVNTYGKSKLAGEEAVRAGFPQATVLRTAWVYSDQGRNFPIAILKLAKKVDEIPVVIDQAGCPSFADDVAEGILTIAERLLAGQSSCGEILHMASSDSATRFEWAEEILALSKSLGGPRARIRPVATSEFVLPAARPLNSRLSSERLQAVYGIRLPPWRNGLARCMSRLAQNGWSLV